MIKIFHGSSRIIERPSFQFGNPHNDYGQGFYCTKSLELAKEWACQKNTDGFANCYELRDENLSILDLSHFTILHWISILMQNRIFSPKSPLGKQNLNFLISRYSLPYNKYDLIIGYRANDSYFSFASDFLENIIPIQALATSLQLGSLGMQIVLKSQKAFENLLFINAEKANHATYYEHYKNRDSNARKAYLENLRYQKPEDAIYLIDIIRNSEILNAIQL